jgi:hypothetical protein
MKKIFNWFKETWNGKHAFITFTLLWFTGCILMWIYFIWFYTIMGNDFAIAMSKSYGLLKFSVIKILTFMLSILIFIIVFACPISFTYWIFFTYPEERKIEKIKKEHNSKILKEKNEREQQRHNNKEID